MSPSKRFGCGACEHQYSNHPSVLEDTSQNRCTQLRGLSPTPLALYSASTLGEGRTMADRTLRGARIGATSLQGDQNVELAPRRSVRYLTEQGTYFSVMFDADAEPPAEWSDQRSGEIGFLDDEAGRAARAEFEVRGAPGRTPWDMLLERRSVEELRELLEERLQLLRARRGTAKK